MRRTLLFWRALGLLFLSFSAVAQTNVFIGDTTGADSYFYGPIYRSSSTSSFNYCHYGYIYEASELGIPVGTVINEISWKKQTSNTLTGGVCDFTIRMKESTATSFGSSERYDSLTSATLTTVYSATDRDITGAADTWVTFTLSTPFTYNGGSLIITTDFNRDGATSNGAIDWYYETASGKGVGRAGSSAPSASTTTTSTYSGRRPAVRMNVTYPAGACLAPTALGSTNLTSTSADIYWTTGGATQWYVEYGTSGFAVGTGTTMLVSNDTLSLSSLTANTTYDFYVKDSCASSSSLNAGPHSFTTPCAGTMSGTYTINAGLPASSTNFTSFSAAAAELSACGISGPVTINVAAGSYTDYVTLTAIPGASSTNTVHIRGAGSSTTTLEHDATTQNATVLLNGADWVTISNLKISTLGTSSGSWCVRLTGRADHNRIDSCILDMPDLGSFADIAGVTASASATSSSTAGDNAHDFTMTYTEVQGGYYGARFEGSGGSPSSDSTVTIIGCTFDSNIGYGAYFDDIHVVTLTSNTVLGASLTSKDGFYFTDVVDFDIQSNGIYVPDYGIYISDGNFDATPGARSKMINNMISSTDDESVYTDDFEMVDVYHNTIYTGGGTSAYGFRTNDISEVTFKNNIFHAAGSYAFYSVDNFTSDATIVVDHNVYYTGGSTLIYLSSSNTHTDLTSWQTADATRNVNSAEGDATFVGAPNDLHVIGTVANDAGDNSVGITVDIDGDTRPASGSTVVDIGADEFSPPSCTAPSGLGVIGATATTADIYWTTGGASNWHVEYGMTGFTQGSGTLIVASNDTITLTGLSANTTYQFFVRDSCGAGDVSPWIGPASFTTACAAFVAPHTESFDVAGVIPNCWSTYNNNSSTAANSFFKNTSNNWPGWGASGQTDNTGNGGYAVGVDGSSPGNNTEIVLESPFYDVSGLSSAQLSFSLFQNNADLASSPTNQTIYIDFYDGSAWNDSIWGYSGNDPNWLTMTVDLSTFTITGNVQFRFVVDQTTAATAFYSDIVIDDITVGAPAACNDPSMLTLMSIDSTSADVYWTSGGASNWNIEIGLSGFVQGTGAVIAAPNDTIAISPLSPNTTYDLYVQDSCGAGNVSAWIGPLTFTTPCATQSLPYSENFDAGQGCFVVFDGGSGPDSWFHDAGTGSNLDGTGFMRVDSDAAGSGAGLLDEDLESPTIDASSVSNFLILEFDHYFRSIGSDTGTVEVWDGTAWVQVYQTTSSVGGWSNPSHETIDVTAHANANFKVRFNYNDGNSWAWYWAVDNFSLEDKCPVQSLPYAENFDTGFGCFEAVDGGTSTDTWFHDAGTGSNLDGTGFMRVDSDAAGSGAGLLLEILNSPVIDASTVLGTLVLEFDQYFRSIGSDTGTVEVWDGTAWVQVYQTTSSVGGWSNPDKQSIDITTYANANLQVRFVYHDGNTWAWYWAVDNFSITDVGCFASNSLGAYNITTTGADVYWTGGGTATNWNIEYGPSGFTQGAGTVMAVTNDTASISGLMSNTAYDFYVQDSCGVGNVSAWTGPFTFNTACGTFVAPHTESFDVAAVIPNCWVTYNNNSSTAANSFFKNTSNNWPGWGASGQTDNTGNGGYAVGVDGSSPGNNTEIVLESPMYDITALSTPQLSFSLFQNNANLTSSATNQTIYINFFDGAVWNDSIWGYSGNDPNWLTMTVDLTTFTVTGDVQFRFVVDQTTAATAFYSDIVIDDISVADPAACPDPSMLGVMNLDTASADLYWTSGGASNWNIEIGATGFVQGTGSVIAAPNDTVALIGLTPNTTYDVYVQDSCGPGNVSNWVGPITFSTTCAPQSLPYMENFDAGQGCFIVFDGGSGPDSWFYDAGTGNNLDGTGFMRVDSDAAGSGAGQLDEDLVSPVIDASVVTQSLILEFDHYFRSIGSDTGTVEVWDGTSWVQVYQTTVTVGGWSAPVHEEIDVTLYANANFQVRFNYNDGNTWAWYWSVDNFSVVDKCPVQTLPYTENFDTDQGCFSIVDGGASVDTWFHDAGTGSNLDGTGFMRVDSDAAGSGAGLLFEILHSPKIDASSVVGTLVLDFDQYFRSIGSDTGTVEVWDGTAWMQVYQTTSSVGAWSNPDHQSIDITAYANAELQVRFVYNDGNTWAWYWAVDNFSVSEVGCFPPSALGAFNVTTTTADIYWTGGGSAIDWNIEYGASGFTPGGGSMMNSTNDTASLSSLMANTSYDFYVRDSCGAGNVSAWIGPFTFTTACATFVAPHTESFDSAGVIPNCWITYNNNASTAANSFFKNTSNNWPGWGASGRTDNTGNGGYAVGVDGSSPGNNTEIVLESPMFDITGLTAAELSFYLFQNNANLSSSATNQTIYVNFFDGAVWNDSIWGYTGNDTNWLKMTVDLTTFTVTGDVQFRFVVDQTTAATAFYSDIIIDDITVGNAAACPDPSMLGATNITTSGADIYWTGGGAANWNIEYGVSGFTPGGGNGMAATNDTVPLGSLMANTAYDFYVQDSCGAGNVSNWVGPFTFRTLCNSFVAPFLETFEDTSASVNCWSNELVTGVNLWTIGTGSSGGSVTTANTGTKNAVFTSSSGGPHITRWVSPVIDITGLTNPVVDFWYAQEDWAGDQNATNLYYRTSPTSPWVLIGGDTSNVAAWTNVVVPLPSPSATYQIAFEGVDDFGRANVLDDIAIIDGPPCPTAGADTTVYVCETDSVDISMYLTATDSLGILLDDDGTGALFGEWFDASLVGPGSYDFTYVVGSPICPFDSATVTVMVDSIPFAGGDSSITTCDTVFVDLDDYLTINDTNGTWVDLDGTGALFGSVFDASIVTPNASYQFGYVLVGIACTDPDTAIVTVTVDSCTIGLSEWITGGLDIYPNPTTGRVSIDTRNWNGSGTAKLELYSLNGQLVRSEVIEMDGTVELDITSLSSGMYNLRLVADDRVYMQQVIKE